MERGMIGYTVIFGVIKFIKRRKWGMGNPSSSRNSTSGIHISNIWKIPYSGSSRSTAK